MNYYNEYDKHAAAWLRELITAGLIPAGHVDERSICDVQPDDLDGFCQVHLFAGIGGWSRALQLAGWPADRPAWSCSCPCQPFSCAGKGEAQADSRHLWPEAFRLIRECRPDTIFGEQVKAAIGFGWLDGISADLESAGYACGAAVLGAHSVGAPHIRQRLYWVAQSQSEQHDRSGDTRRGWGQFTDGRTTDNCGGLAHSEQPRLEGHTRHEHDRNEPGRDGAHAAGPVAQGGTVGYCEHCRESYPESSWKWSDGKCPDCGMGITNRPGSQPGQPAAEAARYGSAVESNGGPNFWSAFDLIPCRDGKTRRIEPILFIDIDGISAIMGSCWNNCIHETQEIALKYAKTQDDGNPETLLALWENVCKESVRTQLGRHDQVQSSKILLFALCQSSRNLGKKFDCATSRFSKVEEEIMRGMWDHRTSARSSQKQGLDGSCPEQSSNLVPSLPHEKTPEAGQILQNLRIEKQRVGPVLEALSEIQKIWQSIADKAGREQMEKIRTGIEIAEAMMGFPLAGKVPGRVTLLKGSGNAIVPQVAAEFVKAFLEI